MQEPDTEPMPPMTTISRISYVMAEPKGLGLGAGLIHGQQAPPTPAKKELMHNAKRLWREPG
jgi:hypothetical protein